MLTLKDKIRVLTKILSQEEISYADTFNADIGVIGKNCDYKFLEKLNTKKEIEYWINKLKSRIVMKEDEATVGDIIDDYILCG